MLNLGEILHFNSGKKKSGRSWRCLAEETDGGKESSQVTNLLLAVLTQPTPRCGRRDPRVSALGDTPPTHNQSLLVTGLGTYGGLMGKEHWSEGEGRIMWNPELSPNDDQAVERSCSAPAAGLRRICLLSVVDTMRKGVGNEGKHSVKKIENNSK